MSKKIEEIEALRALLVKRRVETVAFGKSAFAEENPAAAHEKADRLDRLQRAEAALSTIEEALTGFPESPFERESRERAESRKSVISPDHAGKEVRMETKKVKARGRWTGSHLVVREGSIGSTKRWSSFPEHLNLLRDALAIRRHIEVRGDTFCFLKDVLFDTPSAASAFLSGRSSNGRQEWKLKDGQPLGTILDEEDTGS